MTHICEMLGSHSDDYGWRHVTLQDCRETYFLHLQLEYGHSLLFTPPGPPLDKQWPAKIASGVAF